MKVFQVKHRAGNERSAMERIVKTTYQTACLAGTIFLLSSISPAQAESNHGRISGREFRQMNPGIDRGLLRQTRHEMLGRLGGNGFNQTRHDIRLQRHGVDNSAAVRARFESLPESIALDLVEPAVVVENRHRVVLDRNVDLDLSSSQRNIVLGEGLFANVQSVTITLGGTEKSLHAGAQVTTAEYMAVKQVLSTGSQDLVLNESGRAVAGSLDMNAITVGGEKFKTASLINPAGVTVYGDFSRSSEIDISGNFVNSGSVYTYSSDSNVRRASIHANNITNESGALISSVLPEERNGATNAAVKHFNLSLSAGKDFLNAGTIESSGDLIITAGGTIRNETNAPSGVAAPVLAAHDHVILQSEEVSNAGLISSQNGNVTFNSSGSSALNIYNSNTVEALNGSINLRSADYSGAFDTGAHGGNWLSNEFNVQAGSGLATLNVGALTGTVNQSGTAAHLTAATSELNLGKICLTGDPTFFNTAGTINVTGDISVGEALTIIASGNVAIASNIDVGAQAFNQGFPVTLIAGANIVSTTGGANQAALGPIPPANNNNGSVTLDGTASASGGFVSLGVDTRIFSGTSQNTNNGSGADTLLVAFAGAGINSGNVIMNAGSQVLSNGSSAGFGNNGNITIIGNGSQHTIAGLDSGIAKGLGGQISISSAIPTKSTGSNVVYLANGSLAAGSSQIVAGTQTAGNIVFNGAVDSVSSIDVTTNGNITVGTLGSIDGRITRLTNTGSVFLNNNSVVNASVFLQIDTLGNVAPTGDALLSSGNQLDIISLQNIGLSTLTRVNVDTPNLSVNGDDVFVNFLNGGNIGSNVFSAVVETSSALGTLDITANGSLSINKNITTANGDLNIQTTGGKLETLVGNLVTLTANNGDLNFINSGVNKKTDSIFLGSSATLQAFGGAGLGNVLISLGTLAAPVAGKAPKANVVQNITPPGQIFFSKKGITANAPNNTLNAKGADLVFNNSLVKKNLILGGNVTITADPPVMGDPIVILPSRFSDPKGGSLVQHTGNQLTRNLPGVEEFSSLNVPQIPTDFRSSLQTDALILNQRIGNLSSRKKRVPLF